MKCPNCSKRPMSFLRFMFTVDPTETSCGNCHARLVATPKWRTSAKVDLWISIGFAIFVIFNGIGFLIQQHFPVPYFGYLFWLFVAGGIILEVVFFNRFEYRQAAQEG